MHSLTNAILPLRIFIFCFFWLLVDTTNANISPPISSSDIEKSITKGIDFLVGHQNKNGSWGGPGLSKDINLYAPVPDGHQTFLVASSALALHGLLESRDQRPETLSAIAKGEAWLLSILPKTRYIDPRATYSIWAHAYGLRALASLYRYHNDPEKRALYKKHAIIQINKLNRTEDVNGGWDYLDFQWITAKPSGITTCFTTATAILAMHDAAEIMDIPLDPVIIRRATRSILIQRTPDFSYVYSRNHRYRPRGDISRPAGSIARSQACNAAMRVFGDTAVTDQVITTWLQRLSDRNGWLAHGIKRPIPHEAPAAVSGYFYYYGHYYASECIHLLPEDQQAPWKLKLAALIIPKQEKNGSWWDYPLFNYHRAYGTGYALVTLVRCR